MIKIVDEPVDDDEVYHYPTRTYPNLSYSKQERKFWNVCSSFYNDMEEGEFWQSDEEDDEKDASAKNCLEMEHFLQDFRSGMIPFYEQVSDFLKIALFHDKSLEE